MSRLSGVPESESATAVGSSSISKSNSMTSTAKPLSKVKDSPKYQEYEEGTAVANPSSNQNHQAHIK